MGEGLCCDPSHAVLPPADDWVYAEIDTLVDVVACGVGLLPSERYIQNLTVLDGWPPAVESVWPLEASVDIRVSTSSLLFTATEPLRRGVGQLQIVASLLNTVVATASPLNVTVSGSKATVYLPPSSLDYLTLYHVVYPSGFMTDRAGNALPAMEVGGRV